MTYTDKQPRDANSHPRKGDVFRSRDKRRRTIFRVVCPTGDQTAVRVQPCDEDGSYYDKSPERIVTLKTLKRCDFGGNALDGKGVALEALPEEPIADAETPPTEDPTAEDVAATQTPTPDHSN